MDTLDRVVIEETADGHCWVRRRKGRAIATSQPFPERRLAIRSAVERNRDSDWTFDPRFGVE